MTLRDAYPREARVGKRVYHFRAPFDSVLAIIAAFGNDRLTQADKVRFASRTLFGWRPWSLEKQDQAVTAVLDALRGEDKPATKPRKQVLDIDQDAALIRAAFRQQYGIDLDAQRGRLHYLAFCDLLGGITGSTQLGHVMEIRAADMPAPNKHNREMRMEMARQKAAVAIKRKAKGAAQMDAMWDSLLDRLIAQAKGGDGHV